MPLYLHDLSGTGICGCISIGFGFGSVWFEFFVLRCLVASSCQAREFVSCCFSVQDSSWPLVVAQCVSPITTKSAQGHSEGAMDPGQDTPDKCVSLSPSLFPEGNIELKGITKKSWERGTRKIPPKGN